MSVISPLARAAVAAEASEAGSRHRSTDPRGPAGGSPLTADRPLVGFTVAITADRRRDELAALLERRGARVMVAPALRIVPIEDDLRLREATLALVRRPPTITVVSTAIGLRGWMEAAEGWGVADRLTDALRGGYLIARGAKARGALRAIGLAEHWSPASESCQDVLEHLLDRGVAGERIAVQLHGSEQPEFTGALRAAGAEVVEALAYRWVPPPDPAPLRRLVDAIAARQVDAVAFTSAPASESVLAAAGPERDQMLTAFREGVLAACVGPVTAAPLQAAGVPCVWPPRARLGALARTIVDELPARCPSMRVAGSTVSVRGHAVVVDGVVRPLAQAPMAILRALAAARGRVLSRAELLATLPRGSAEHAVEMAVNRLRAALGGPAFVQTVVKRGYRLRLD
jgi:uroporphyrinogen-III synthase